MQPKQTKAYRELQRAASVTEICEAVKRNYHEILLSTHWKDTEFLIYASTLDSFTIDNIYIDKQGNTGNSHYAPKGKKTNWGGRDEFYPRGFPGFSGNANWRIANVAYDRGLQEFCLGRALHSFGIHCGTGGGGHGNNRDTTGYKFHVQIFFEDFPALESKVQEYQEVMRRGQFLAKLEGKPYRKSLETLII